MICSLPGRNTTSYLFYWPLVSGEYEVLATLAQAGGRHVLGSPAFTRPLETRQDKRVAFDWGLFQYNSPSSALPGEPKVSPR